MILGMKTGVAQLLFTHPRICGSSTRDTGNQRSSNRQSGGQSRRAQGSLSLGQGHDEDFHRTPYVDFQRGPQAGSSMIGDELVFVLGFAV